MYWPLTCQNRSIIILGDSLQPCPSWGRACFPKNLFYKMTERTVTCESVRMQEWSTSPSQVCLVHDEVKRGWLLASSESGCIFVLCVNLYMYICMTMVGESSCVIYSPMVEGHLRSNFCWWCECHFAAKKRISIQRAPCSPLQFSKVHACEEEAQQKAFLMRVQSSKQNVLWEGLITEARQSWSTIKHGWWESNLLREIHFLW